MMITLEILDAYRSRVDSSALETAVKTAIQQQSAPADASLTLIISDDEQLHTLNRQYRNVDAPTDVLSFSADFIDPESNVPYLGDILISYERATAQATSGGHSIADELLLLTVHGVLHLLGHDHATPEEKTRMWAAQNEILRRLGAVSVISEP